VANANLLLLDEQGQTILTTASDARGRFQLSLVPGAYQLVPQPVTGLMGGAPAQHFSVIAGMPLDLNVLYDTGIR
jgi:hypothetical protein